MKAFEEKVLATVERYQMLSPGERVLVAVSGGVDSLTLLTVLKELPLDLVLSVFHLNHGLRPLEAKAEARLVADFCAKRSIPCHIKEINLLATKGKDSVEVAARRERYRLLEAVAREEQVSKIALGHHADDQVETMVMRFLKGAGPQGMAGIPPVRTPYVRPLFEVTREEIKEYAKNMGLVWAEDTSNQQTDYDRNKIRHSLLPLLLKYQPQLKKRLRESAYIFQEWEEFILAQVRQVIEAWGVQEQQKEVRVACGQWLALPLALRRAVFREVFFWLAPEARLEYKHSVIFFSLCQGENGKRVLLPGGIEGVKEKDALIMRPVSKEADLPDFNLQVNIPGCTLLPFGLGEIEAYVGGKGLLPKNWQETSVQEAFFDWQDLTLPLYLRRRRPGDRFHPLGLAGSKKIKDFFSDHKVIKSERDRVPILMDAKGQILWVVGMRQGKTGRITEKTEKVLLLRYIF